MGETIVTKQGTPQSGAGQSSTGKGGSTSNLETFTKEQMRKLVSDALTEQGRKHKMELDPILKERDDLKSQLQTNTSNLAENKTEIERLQSKIDDLASTDPEKFNAVKELSIAREERRQMQAERRALDVEKQTHGERIKKADDFEREVSILKIVEEYDGGDAAKLSDLCSTLGVKAEEQIRKVADTFWSKKAAEPESVDSLNPYPGTTSGGSDRIGDLPPKQWEDALKKKMMK